MFKMLPVVKLISLAIVINEKRKKAKENRWEHEIQNNSSGVRGGSPVSCLHVHGRRDL